MTSNIQNYKPSFQGRLIISSFAANIINERFQKMPGALRTKALEEYDSFIRKVVNSNYDVRVSKIRKKDLCAGVFDNTKELTVAYTEDKNNIIAKLGLRSPVKFMQKAFERAQENFDKIL